MPYIQREDGEWFEIGRRHKLTCCDCALVHSVQLRVRNGRVEAAFTRDNRATAQRRRWKLNKTLAQCFRDRLSSNQEVPLATKTKKKTAKARKPAAKSPTKRSATTAAGKTKAAPKAKGRAPRKAA